MAPPEEEASAYVIDAHHAISACGGIDIVTAGKLFRRCFLIHQSLIRALAGWMIATPRYEDKYTFGYHLWDHAQHAAAIQARLLELRGGMAHPSAEPDFTVALDEILHAETTEEFLEGAYGEVLPQLIDLYRWICHHADAVANAPDVALARRLAGELATQFEWSGERISADKPSPWRLYIRSLCARSKPDPGNQTAPQIPRPHAHRFERPRTIFADSRLKRGGIPSLEQRQQLPYRDELIEQFRVFFNEFYAACILAAIVYEVASTAIPFEFTYDLAHQCWDEIRHSQFGLVRLSEMGLAPDRYDPTLYELIEGLPFLHRFCHLTLNLEPYFMARKKPRVEQYEAAGDERSRLFADVDWSDEINHVRYGHKWMKWFLKEDARDISDIKREIQDHISRYCETTDGVAPASLSPF